LDKKDSQSRKWQITINNPTEKDFFHEKINNILQGLKSWEYHCLCDEVGEHENYHSHIFVFFRNGVRFSTLKKLFPEAHFEVARGSSDQNRDYILKQGKWAKDRKHETTVEGTFEEYGEIPQEHQGARNDLNELYSLIKQGLSDFELVEANPDNIRHFDKFEKIRQTLKYEEFKAIYRELHVQYIWGETGIGKTRYVMEKYGFDEVFRVTDYQHPFDNYHGQEIIVFDEFRGNLSIQSMLNYLDGYPLELPCRYANKFACYNTVYLISNIPLEKQYPFIQENEPATWKAFCRRINKVIEFTSDGEQIEIF
jgi:hypothetical protein